VSLIFDYDVRQSELKSNRRSIQRHILIIVFRVKRLFWCLNLNINLAFRVKHNFKQFSQYTGTKRGWRERANLPYTGLFRWKLFEIYFWFCVIWRGHFKDDPHWSVTITSCNFRSLTSEQQIKIPFLEWVRTNNKFQIIIVGHGDSLSYFILSWLELNSNFTTSHLKFITRTCKIYKLGVNPVQTSLLSYATFCTVCYCCDVCLFNGVNFKTRHEC